MEEKKRIRFIDSHYHTLFSIADGDSIEIVYPDGKREERVCTYIDEYHTQVGARVFHICEFAEIMEANGKSYCPAECKEKEERKETAAKQEQTEPVREKKTDRKKLRDGNAISEGPVKVEYAVTDTEENLPGQMTFGMEESESGLEEFSDEETKAEDPVQTEEISVDEEITAETDADGFRAVKETDEVPFDEDDEISFDAEEEEETPEETAEEVLEDMAHEEDAEDEVKWAEKVICNFVVYAGTPLGEMMQDARGYQTIKWLVQRYKGQNQEIQKAAKILLDHEKEMQKAA